MIEITNIQVLNNLSIDYLLIKFEVSDTDEDLNNYLFHIYRSSSPKDGYNCITTLHNCFEYQDYDVNLLKTDVRYYYKIEVENTVTQQKQMSKIYGSLRHHIPDKISSAIAYQYEKYLEVVGNEPVLLLLRKRFGQKCQLCWDDVRMQSTTDRCPECYQTGYSGGYYDPIPIQISYMSPPDIHQVSASPDEVGYEESLINVWTLNYPIIHANDIIVDCYNDRYNILSVQRVTKNNKFVLRQILNIQKLPPNHVIYEFPIEAGSWK